MIINKGDVNSATYNLSSRWSGGWKTVLMVAYGILYVSLIGYFITSDRTFFYKIYYVLLFSYAFYLLIKMTYLLKQVSFDDTHLYVNEKEQEVIVPLENIASIEINTLGGTYKVNMLHDEKWGKMFYFKTSLIYPLNFRKKDALVDLLRNKIQLAKSQHFSIRQRDALPSALN